MEPNFHITFDKCPNCESPLRFLEELGKELKDRGLARDNWNMRYDQRTGPVVDDARSVMLPIGVKMPGYFVVSDVCMDCGTIYAIELRRLEATTHASPPAGPSQLTDKDGGSLFPAR